MPVVKTCERCGVGYPSKPSAKSRFCSPRCSNEWKEEYFKAKSISEGATLEVSCLQCGQRFTKPASKRNKKDFCGRECLKVYRQSRRVDKSCEICGTVKNLLPKDVKTFRFCSLACRGAWQSVNNVGAANPAWRGKGGIFQCESCGKTRPKVNGWKNRFCDLKCFGAYKSVNHRGENNARWRGGLNQNEVMKRWREENPEKALALRQKRRARELSAPRIEDFTRGDVVRIYGTLCYLCGRNPKRMTIDHVIPLIRGGAHTLENVRPACWNCNSRKGIKLLSEFICFLGERPAMAA